MSSRKRAYKSKNKQPAQKRGLLMIGGVVVLALAVVAVLIFAFGKPPEVGEIITVEKGIWPQADGKALGPADAPVVVREFSDFQCPYCRQFSGSVQDQIINDYVATGKVRFEYHHYIVIDGNVGGSESRRSAQASECASEQGMFWDYHEMLFANQSGEGTGAFSDVRLKAFAETLGLDTEKFNTCFNSKRYAGNVTQDEAQAISLKVRGTPALFVNDQVVSNPMDYNSVKAAIDAALTGASQ